MMTCDVSSRLPNAKSIFTNIGRELDSQSWLAGARQDWPAPIAHELAQLLRMLDEGSDAGGILMQVRDTAEVLLKSLALITVADLIAHGDQDCATAARQALFSRQLTLGSWKQAFTALARHAGPELMVPELLGLASSRSTFCKALDTYIEQRNSDIGHGAYRPDSVELACRVREQLLGQHYIDVGYKGGLDRAFAAVEASGIWQVCALHIDTPAGSLFSGAAAVGDLRTLPHDHPGTMIRRLHLTRNGRTLDLFPLISGRICGECHNRDAFLFDSPLTWMPQTDLRFNFLDYANGHRLRIDAHKGERELAELARMPLADLRLGRQAPQGGGEFSSHDVVRLLDDVMFDNRFLSPEWLRVPLRRHMKSNSKGIFWVRAPGHIGKTTFVRGLYGEGLRDAQKEEQRALLGSDGPIDVVPVFLKREYRFDTRQFASALENQVRGTCRRDTRLTLQLPREGKPAKLQAGFVTFAQEALEALAMRPADSGTRLVLAIDGLDELGEPDGAISALDYLPPVEALPESVTILLTSRPANDCPRWMQERLERGVAQGHTLYEVGLEDPDYVQLLRTYVGHYAGIPPADESFNEVFQFILEHSQSLFLIVSFLCDLIRENTAVSVASELT